MAKRDPYLLQLLEEEHAKARALRQGCTTEFRPLTKENIAAIQEAIRRHDEAMEKVKQVWIAAGLPIAPPECSHE